MRLGLTPNDHIVDIGCGCGRLAIPFGYFLNRDHGRYTGTDVWAEGTDWCSRQLSTEFPNLDFHCLHADSNYYFTDHPDYDTQNHFPLSFLADSSVDGVFAVSVFTHLTLNDTSWYLNEIARTLRPGKLAYVTGFIIDEWFHHYVASSGLHSEVRQHEDGGFYAYQGQDHFAGLTLATWRSLFDAAGLHLVSIDLGAWAEKPGARSFQDTFILMAPGTAFVNAKTSPKSVETLNEELRELRARLALADHSRPTAERPLASLLPRLQSLLRSTIRRKRKQGH